MHRNTIAAIAQLVVSIVALGFIYIQYLSAKDITNQSLLFVIFFLFAANMLSDKIAAAFTGYSFDRDQHDIKELFNRLPGMIGGRHDIIVFHNRDEGLRYCIFAAKNASHVRNTVLRYGVKKSSPFSNSFYLDWLKTKRDSLANTPCTWTEIVSRYLNDDDPAYQITAEYNNRCSQYQARFLDDSISRMVQMTLFEHVDGSKEIVFGWEFPGMENGPCFLTKNDKLIEYFDKYFAFNFRGSSETKEESPAPIGIPLTPGSGLIEATKSHHNLSGLRRFTKIVLNRDRRGL